MSTFFAAGNYLEYPFSQTFYYTRNFIQQVNQCATADSPFNETHWDDAQFTAGVKTARTITDDHERGKLIRQLQQQLFDDGGYIIWGFANQVDAYHNYVAGLRPHPGGMPLSQAMFHNVWIAEV